MRTDRAGVAGVVGAADVLTAAAEDGGEVAACAAGTSGSTAAGTPAGRVCTGSSRGPGSTCDAVIADAVSRTSAPIAQATMVAGRGSRRRPDGSKGMRGS